MNRKKRLLLDTAVGFLKQIVVIICGFILPRYMLSSFGSSINGLVSSIAHFLGFISLLEMGIGPVVQASLYGPLAKNDMKSISEVVKSSERFFRKIAAIFLVYIAIMAVVFPVFINKEYEFLFSASLIVIISISTLAQYMFGATYQLLLNADQRSYIQNLLSITATILNTVICVVLMINGASIHLVKLASASVFVLRPIGQLIYVKKHYDIDKEIILNGEPIKQKWNGFAQHLSAVICGNIDVVLLTLFASLSDVSIYSVYFLVINGITILVMTLATGVEPFFGNILAKNDTVGLKKAFSSVELITHIITTMIFTCTAILIVPFIKIYTSGITDANYIQPIFGVILTMAYASQCLRVPYFRIIKAAGHFKETQSGSFITTAINAGVSTILIFKYGLEGIAIGTLVAMLYHTIYFVLYLSKNILKRSTIYFVKYIVVDIIVFGLSLWLTNNILLTKVNYWGFFIMAFKVFVIVLGISVICFSTVFWKTIKEVSKNQ